MMSAIVVRNSIKRLMVGVEFPYGECHIFGGCDGDSYYVSTEHVMDHVPNKADQLTARNKWRLMIMRRIKERAYPHAIKSRMDRRDGRVIIYVSRD